MKKEKKFFPSPKKFFPSSYFTALRRDSRVRKSCGKNFSKSIRKTKTASSFAYEDSPHLPLRSMRRKTASPEQKIF